MVHRWAARCREPHLASARSRRPCWQTDWCLVRACMKTCVLVPPLLITRNAVQSTTSSPSHLVGRLSPLAMPCCSGLCSTRLLRSHADQNTGTYNPGHDGSRTQRRARPVSQALRDPRHILSRGRPGPGNAWICTVQNFVSPLALCLLPLLLHTAHVVSALPARRQENPAGWIPRWARSPETRQR
jgi:hypothetical protein